ncbi:MAG: hypothetical protein ACRC9T_07580, partial [Vibrionaceae bacterium]
ILPVHRGEFMRNSRFCVMLAAIAITGGCASNQYSVTYASDPDGAQLYCNGVSQGYTPVTLNYTLDEKIKKSGVLKTAPCKLKWVSGATAKTGTQFSLSQFPYGVTTKVARPNAPNAHIDHSFALQLQHSRRLNQVLKDTQAIKDEQERVKQEKEDEDKIRYLCNLGLLEHPLCKKVKGGL